MLVGFQCDTKFYISVIALKLVSNQFLVSVVQKILFKHIVFSLKSAKVYNFLSNFYFNKHFVKKYLFITLKFLF